MCLQECYNALLEDGRLETPHRPVEPWQSVERVEQFRAFWRPCEVKVVLLAESHLFWHVDGLERVMQAAQLPVALAEGDYPHGFAWFVYCLGYGEQQLFDHGIAHNPGTPPYWKIFYSCLHRPTGQQGFFARVLVGGNSDLAQRLEAKSDTLFTLRRRGIWLVDASIVALNRLPPNRYRRILQRCWDEHISAKLQELAPLHVIVIGKGVYGAIQERLHAVLAEEEMTVIPQPQARIPAADHLVNLQLIYDRCEEHAAP